MSLLVRGKRVVLPDGTRPATIHIRDGRIAEIGGYDAPGASPIVIDAGDYAVLPGLVDSHIHINEPGRTEWEGFDSATRAAAAGGVTTLVDMPLNSIPSTTDVAALEEKRACANGRIFVDVGFWGGVVPGNTGNLEALAAAGVCGFKCFLCPSGVDEFAHVTESDLRAALPVLAKVGRPLLAHAELPELLRDPEAEADPREYRTWLDSRPPASEVAAIQLLLRLAEAYRAQIHIVHLATPEALASIADARSRGVRVTVETCPHYLTFAAQEIPDGATSFKCAPPIRSVADREGLWQGLSNGDVDLVATDHSPAPPAMKSLESGDFMRAWGGIASIQLGLAAVGTGALERGQTLEQVVNWMATQPARLAGLDDRKGSIAVGKDADLIVWDPDAEVIVDPARLHHRHLVTPYAGRRLKGRVVRTILRGQVIFEDGTFVGPPAGMLLTRP